MKNILKWIDSAQRRSVPLVAVTTADQQAFVQSVSGALDESCPRVAWDCVRGVVPLNKAGQESVQKIHAAVDDPLDLTNFVLAVTTVRAHLATSGMLLAYNAHRQLDTAQAVQAVALCRDAFKTSNRMLVLLAPEFNSPLELRHDIVLLDEDLPDDGRSREIVEKVVTGSRDKSGVPLKITAEELGKAAPAVRGLSAFEAEQVVALSLGNKGLNLQKLWQRKMAQCNQTRGITMTLGESPTLDELRGAERLVEFARRRFEGPERPEVVVIIDEGEKQMAGHGTDTSGVVTDATGVLLREMEDNRYDGVVLMGFPGTGKTFFGRALGNSYGVPTIVLDIPATQDKHVGESQTNVRAAMRMIRSVAGSGRAFFILTCNNDRGLPPELKRRFRSGIWFMDAPGAEELDTLWKQYSEASGVQLPSFYGKKAGRGDDGWTGAEVRNACETAYALGIATDEAMSYVVPVLKSAPEMVTGLRGRARGAFLSAQYAGTYRGVEQLDDQVGTRSVEVA